MKKELFLNSELFKIFLPIFIVACIIKLFGAGYHFGQWLYVILH